MGNCGEWFCKVHGLVYYWYVADWWHRCFVVEGLIMAVKTFTDNTGLPASDINTYLANSGLVYIKQQTIGTAVSSVTVSSAFSADYDNYVITCHGGASSAQGALGLQLGATVTGYYGNMIYSTHGSTAVLAVSDNNAVRFTHIGSANGDFISLNVNLLNPFVASKTVATGVGTVYTTVNGSYNGWLNNSTSYTAFSLIPNAGTLTGGIITVYGYRKA